MPRTGNYFDVVLKSAHLNWGTEGIQRSRNAFEAYIPISMPNARAYTITAGELFNCYSNDGFFHGPLKATGTQGPVGEFGKNFYKDGDLRALGYWLKDRVVARPGDIIRVFFIDENTIELSKL